MKKFDLNEVSAFIEGTSEATKIYIGADSETYKKNGVFYVDYTTVVVIHHDGRRGCKIFGRSETERNYDQKKSKPNIRLMNEVMKAAQMYLDLEEAIGYRHYEVHLDINPNVKFASSAVVSQAIGYIRGMCNVIPMIKPNAFAASYAADRFSELKSSASFA